MRTALRSVLALALIPGICFAQTPATSTPPVPPPPLVPAPAPATTDATGTPPAPGAQQGAPTPPPPGYVPPPGGASPYYSPYGPGAAPAAKPGPEIGLMISESLFGMLTAAGTSLLTYFLLLRPGGALWGGGGLSGGGGTGTELVTIMTLVIFGATPLAVAQTQLGLANGSRYYEAELWPPALAGLLTQAAVLGIFAAVGGFASETGYESAAPGLLVGTIAVVPLAQMAALNFFKHPKGQAGIFGGLEYTPEGGLQAGIPRVTPLVGQTRHGLAVGLNVPVLSGQF